MHTKPHPWRWAGSAALAILLLTQAPSAKAEAGIHETRLRAEAAGAVRRPGLYLLPKGARMAELLAAAGGPLPQARLDALNLATPLVDGARVVLPRSQPSPSLWPGRAQAPNMRRGHPRRRGPKPKSPRPAPHSVVLNRADLTQLDRLPGVGPAMAKRILEARAKAGGFRHLEDLREVKGLGAKRLAQLAPYVRLN